MMLPGSLSDEELIRHVDLDASAGDRERELAKRLAAARDYIASLHEFLVHNDLADLEEVTIQ
jgi:hypothetical protein